MAVKEKEKHRKMGVLDGCERERKSIGRWESWMAVKEKEKA